MGCLRNDRFGVSFGCPIWTSISKLTIDECELKLSAPAGSRMRPRAILKGKKVPAF